MGKTEIKPRIGISGWTYELWRKGEFYPEKLAQKNELAFASTLFNTIEVNGTFYAMQKPETYAGWYEETPSDFSFSLKGPQYVTHQKRLGNVESGVANFILSGTLRLEEKLGPFLWQLPPTLPYDKTLLEAFFALLPQTTKQACKMLDQTSEWMQKRIWAETGADRPMRHVLEFRHSSFQCDEFIALAKKYKIAIAICDVEPGHPFLEEVEPADFVYVCLHGAEPQYPKGYSQAQLKPWANKLASWSKKGKEAYVYCNCEHKIVAPANGMVLSNLVFGKEEMAKRREQALAKFTKPATNNRRVGKTKGRGRAKN